MTARKRKNNESYDKYRKSLIKEAIEEKERLSGRMKFTAVRYFRKWVKKCATKIWHKETRTYRRRGIK